MGKAEREPLDPGLHYVNPFCSEIVRYSTREQREEIKTATYTKDMQSADVQLLVVFSVKREDAYNLHVTYGKDYKSKTVVPAVFGAVKDILGQWEADKLVNGREKATKEIFDKATEMMSGQPVRLVSVTILNIDYSDAFEKAIEAKQIATQEAIKAKNRTVQIEEESRQEVIRAEAAAKAKLALAEADANVGAIGSVVWDVKPLDEYNDINPVFPLMIVLWPVTIIAMIGFFLFCATMGLTLFFRKKLEPKHKPEDKPEKK